MLKRIFYYALLPTVSIIILYTLYWFASVASLKGLFLKASAVKLYKSDFTYTDVNVTGFPFSAKIHLNNPKVQGTIITLAADSLLINYNIFTNFLTIQIPNNKFNLLLQEKNKIFCTSAQGLKLFTKMTANPVLLTNNTSETNTLFTYIKFIKYQDHGLNCTPTDNNHDNEIGNYITIEKKTFNSLKKEANYEFTIKADLASRKKVVDGELINYPSISIAIDLGFINYSQTISNIYSKIEKISFIGKEFSINISGFLEHLLYNDFNGNIIVNMTNYKEGIKFLIKSYLAQPNAAIQQEYQQLIYDISNKNNDNDIQFSLCNESTKKSSSCNILFIDFIQKVQAIYSNQDQFNNHDTLNKD